MAVHGITDSQYIKELSKKTFRGLEGKVLTQLHHGGRCFGYRSVPIEDTTRRDQYGRPMISGAQLRVDPEQAKIVRKIFTLYADGLSIKATTKRLNAEGVESPRPRAGREHSWAPSSVKSILENQRYIGSVTYGRTKKVRHPQTGKRIYRHKPESEWIRVASPDQRIVSDKLWNLVQARLAFVNSTYGSHSGKGGLLRSRAASSPYIFSGLLKCGVCGGAVTIASGKGTTHRSASYGCPAREFRGTCGNTRRIASDVLETQLLAKLQHEVLSPEAIDYVFHKLEIEVSKHLSGIGDSLEAMRRRRVTLEAELKNLSRMVAGGMDSPSLRRAITEREAEIKTLAAKTPVPGRNSVHTQIRDLRKSVADELGDLRALLSARDNAMAMRMQLAKHVKEIELLPGEGGTIKYKGEWALLGDGDLLRSWDGAEGQNRTGYAGLFRAALYR
jgi:site-specific DNA recombinase